MRCKFPNTCMWTYATLLYLPSSNFHIVKIKAISMLSLPPVPYPTLPYLPSSNFNIVKMKAISVLCLPVATLPYLTLPYPTLPYPTLPYPTQPFPTLPYIIKQFQHHEIKGYKVRVSRRKFRTRDWALITGKGVLQLNTQGHPNLILGPTAFTVR